MKKALAIVTDSGGMTCHASIVSRGNWGFLYCWDKKSWRSCIRIIKNWYEVTIDATNGIVYEGRIEDLVKSTESEAMALE